MSAPIGNSFWRVAGLSYNQYTAVALNAMKKALKPELAAKKKFDVEMKERMFKNGQPLERTVVSDMFTPSPFSKTA
eukprot:CAMPEP_0171464348 /NCGR_PEP_ID=MMETSP0945-20130129/7693_1 /TAXON_ID=109269 /ORGANISM="Vaucheria litorea, Strain CCMP2940" /LENGTH=75 /DNA_ID=CAMNT_0011991399 /DNA_START=59 /DNA_END=286 /DNA_ORIENTATION=-